MRRRAVYVRTVVFRLPAGGKHLVRAAAERDDRRVTQWVARVVREAVARRADPPPVTLPRADPETESFSLELPGNVVDEVEARVGAYYIPRFVTAAVLAALEKVERTAV